MILQESSKRKAQEAALIAAGQAPTPLRRVDLLATQLKRWPDYDFIMGLPETGVPSSTSFSESRLANRFQAVTKLHVVAKTTTALPEIGAPSCKTRAINAGR